VMAHAQKPDFVFRRNRRVHLNRRGCQFSRLLAAEVCASAVVMLDTPCSEVAWRVLATHSICQFPLHFPSHVSPCAITFQLDSASTITWKAVQWARRALLYKQWVRNIRKLVTVPNGKNTGTVTFKIDWNCLKFSVCCCVVLTESCYHLLFLAALHHNARPCPRTPIAWVLSATLSYVVKIQCVLLCCADGELLSLIISCSTTPQCKAVS
jgi:hypothetical protein